MATGHLPAVTVGTTPTLLYAESHALRRPQSVLFSGHTAALYLGGSDVSTTAYGYKLDVGEQLALDFPEGDSIYAVVAAGTSQVRLLKLGG